MCVRVRVRERVRRQDKVALTVRLRGITVVMIRVRASARFVVG